MRAEPTCRRLLVTLPVFVVAGAMGMGGLASCGSEDPSPSQSTSAATATTEGDTTVPSACSTRPGSGLPRCAPSPVPMPSIPSPSRISVPTPSISLPTPNWSTFTRDNPDPNHPKIPEDPSPRVTR